MDIDEAILHCQDVVNKCNDLGCSIDHRQLMSWLIELKYYRNTYGDIDKLYPSIILTRSNRCKEKICVKDITKIEVKEGVYEGTNYHSRVWFGNDFHYYLESVEEINNLLKDGYT